MWGYRHKSPWNKWYSHEFSSILPNCFNCVGTWIMSVLPRGTSRTMLNVKPGLRATMNCSDLLNTDCNDILDDWDSVNKSTISCLHVMSHCNNLFIAINRYNLSYRVNRALFIIAFWHDYITIGMFINICPFLGS